ncbi:MAG: glycosyltransferase [Armatimonadota bacterium]
MTAVIVLFWVFVALAVYPYLIYPTLILFASILFPRRTRTGPMQPSVSIVIAARNEEANIRERVQNAVAMDYPRDRLEVIIASDGSTDRTNAIVQEMSAQDGRVRLLELPHGGQSAAINAAVAAATGDIVVRTDANTRFSPDVLRKMIMYFADPEVQCVVGKITMVPLEDAPYNMTEGLYWRFEARLRALEALVGVAFVGSGPCMAVRRKSYPQLKNDEGEDLSATLQIISGGGRIVQVSDLGAYDYMDGRTAGQVRCRSRRVTTALRAIWNNRAILNPFRYPQYCFSVLSHKVLRWLTGVWLLGAAVTNAVLMIHTQALLYDALFYLQAAFYLVALAGLLLSHTEVAKVPVFAIPMSILVVSAAFIKGVAAFLLGSRLTRWEPAGSAQGK